MIGGDFNYRTVKSHHEVHSKLTGHHRWVMDEVKNTTIRKLYFLIVAVDFK